MFMPPSAVYRNGSTMLCTQQFDIMWTQKSSPGFFPVVQGTESPNNCAICTCLSTSPPLRLSTSLPLPLTSPGHRKLFRACTRALHTHRSDLAPSHVTPRQI